MHRQRILHITCVALATALLAACAKVDTMSMKTQVMSAWKDPKYALAPMDRIFVISLMRIQPGGRDVVEDAIVARLATAGVTGIAAHKVMSSDPEKPGPTLEEAIKASGAQGVLMVDVKAVGAYEPYTVGQTVTSLSPDTLSSYKYLQRQDVYQPGDYKVAHISSELFLPSLGQQVWTVYTNSYDAANLARNLSDFTLKLVDAMAADRIIASAPPKPAT